MPYSMTLFAALYMPIRVSIILRQEVKPPYFIHGFGSASMFLTSRAPFRIYRQNVGYDDFAERGKVL
jgi:hypothetical protein